MFDYNDPWKADIQVKDNLLEYTLNLKNHL